MGWNPTPEEEARLRRDWERINDELLREFLKSRGHEFLDEPPAEPKRPDPDMTP